MGGSERFISIATGSSRAFSRSRSARNGRWTGNERMPSSSVGAARSIVPCSLSGWRDRASKVVAMFVNSCGVGVRHRRDLRRGAAGLLEELVELGVRVGQGGHDRLEVPEERDEVLDRLVDAGAAAREAVAVALEHRAEVLAEVLVVEAEELVQLHRLGGVGQRDRRARRVGLVRVAQLHLDVLQSERRARAHDQARVRAAAPRSTCRASCRPPRSPAARPSSPPPARRRSPGLMSSTTPTLKPPIRTSLPTTRLLPPGSSARSS